MNDEIVVVLKTFDSFEADRALAALSEEKINALKTYFGVPDFRIGRTLNQEIRIQVASSDSEKAASILTGIGILKP